MNNRKLSEIAILVMQDSSLADQLRGILRERFHLKSLCIGKKDIPRLIMMNKPLFMIWDGRRYSLSDLSLLQWLRDHFSGCPIFALLENHPTLSSMELHKMGISFQFFPSDANFHDDLEHHIQAVLNDLGANESANQASAHNKIANNVGASLH